MCEFSLVRSSLVQGVRLCVAALLLLSSIFVERANSTEGYPFPAPCLELLSGAGSPLEELRHEIWNASIRDALYSGRSAALFSMGKGAKLSKWIPEKSAENELVVSLGSGPDITLPLYIFPTAREIHLVDSWEWWGGGPVTVLQEAFARIKALHNQAVVEVQNAETGFFDSEQKIFSWIANNGSPVVVQVSWQSQSLGERSVRYFFHRVRDYDSRKNRSALLAYLASRGTLGAVVTTGAPYSNATFDAFFKRLPKGGFWIDQPYSKLPILYRLFGSFLLTEMIVREGGIRSLFLLDSFRVLQKK